MTRHLSTYLWTAMKDGSRKPAEATRWIKVLGWGGGWPLARTTDDWRQNSPANRRSRTTASSWARVRWRARTRALRARIRQSPHLIVYLTGCWALQSATASSRSWISFLSFPVSQTRTANAQEGAEAMTGKTSCWRWGKLEFSIRRTFPDNVGHSDTAGDDVLPGR